MTKAKEHAFGWRTLLAKLKALFNDREARELWKWHQQQGKRPGEPDFANHPKAMARQNHRGTIRGKTIAEHARVIAATKHLTIQKQYLDQVTFEPDVRRRISTAALALLTDQHRRPDTKTAAIQILAGWHGNGHLLRQRSLQMNGWQYAAVIEENQHLKGSA